MLRQWLETQGYLKSASSSAADVSHLFLDGGIACVPEEMTGAFNNLYALCLHKKEDMLFVVEKKTPVFRMFFDLDMRTERPLDDEAILEFSRDIRAAVADFYGDASLTTTVCLADSSMWDPKTRSWKTGAHLIWPDVATVSADAVRCRDHVLDALKKKDATKTPQFTTPLETVVDKCVLEKNGMRMIGSHKLVPCGACGSSSGRPCQTCGGRRKVVQRGVYWPRYVVQPDGFPVVQIPEIETLQDARRWVSDTSLRVRTRPPAAVPSAPRTEADEEVLLLGETSSSLTRMSMEPFREGLEAFAKTLPVQFGPFRFTAMYRGGGDCKDDDRTDDNVFIVRTTARYCMNLGRCHRSNNVYFLFSERGAYQMCFCRCQTTEGRKHGLCANFHSQAFPISPPELKLAMFGPSKSDERIRPAPPLKTVVSKEFEALMRRYTSAKKR